MFDFKDGLKSLLNQISQGMDPTISSLLTQTPAGKYPDAYRTVTNIATTAVKPVAMTVLAVVLVWKSFMPARASIRMVRRVYARLRSRYSRSLSCIWLQ